MIRMGRYDVFDKWDIICRAWAGEAVDVGVNRHGTRQMVPEWQWAACRAGREACADYIRLKCEAISRCAGNSAAGENREEGQLNDDLSGLLQQIGDGEFRRRSLKFVQEIQSTGIAASSDELPPRLVARLKEVFKLAALEALHCTDDIGEIPDLEALRSQAQTRPRFPYNAIRGKRDVLAMFCAQYYGSLDVIHIYDICPDSVTLVDLDAENLQAMQRIYPREWTYVCADYKEFLKQIEHGGLVYDLIVADPWRAMAAEVGFDMFPAIMAHCTDTIVIHYVQEMFEELDVVPDDLGLLARAIERRTGVDVVVTEMVARSTENCWLVMRRQG